MSHSKNQALVLAVTEAGISINDAAERFDVTTRWVRILLNRHRDGGIASVSPAPNAHTPAPPRHLQPPPRRSFRYALNSEPQDSTPGPNPSINDCHHSPGPRSARSGESCENTRKSLRNPRSDRGPHGAGSKQKLPTRPGSQISPTGPLPRALHQGARVLILIGGAQTMVVELVTGEVIAEHLLNSQRNYQAKQK